eukprot:UN13284
MTSNELQPLLDEDNDIDAKEAAFNVEIDCCCIRSLTFCSFIVQFLFILVILYVVVAIPVTYFEPDLNNSYIFLSVLIITILTSVFAQYGVYKWGSTAEHIDSLKKQNDEFHKSTEALREKTNRLKSEVKYINEKVISLEHNANELEETEESFDALQKELAGIRGDNQTLHDMLNVFETLFKNAHDITLQHERAWLLSTYYEVSLKG